jgi:hypothetical protein
MTDPGGVIAYRGNTDGMHTRAHDEMSDCVGRGLLEGQRERIRERQHRFLGCRAASGLSEAFSDVARAPIARV